MSIADEILRKEILPTALASDEIRSQIAAEIRARAIFSARMESARYLQSLRSVLAEYSAGKIGAARARELLIGHLASAGIPVGESGSGISDHYARRRLTLILRTNRQMAASCAVLRAQTQDTLAQFPAWELVRFGSRRAPREDWAARWLAAGNACGWDGAIKARMIALKGSRMWDELGRGAGGFRDAIGNPYPPFAFGSGLSWRDVPAAECRAIGLEGAGRMRTVSMAPTADEIREARDAD